jgi:tight adherence protein C
VTIVISLLVFFAMYMFLYWAIRKYSVPAEAMGMRLEAIGPVAGPQAAGGKGTGAFCQWVLMPLADKLSTVVTVPAGLRNMLAKKLEEAGGLSGLSADQLIALTGLAAAFQTVITLAFSLIFKLGLVKMLGAVLAVLLLTVLVPNLLLTYKAAVRQRNIQRELPDILDMITISVEAGLGFDGALAKVAEKMHGTLVEELRRVLQEMRMGLTRREALRSMGARCGNKELSIFISALLQADQLGVGIGKVLRTQSIVVREQRQQQVEQKAMRAPVFMLFPLAICIFPFLFIIILGPAILKIMDNLIR